MAPPGRAVAVSHVGKVRSNNQDSGYAGRHLFVVADGMGGHAGGDVASSLALNRIAEADREYDSTEDAEFALQSTLLAANSLISETVFEHPELTGMGTTVSALARVGDRMALAHIGDSRIYLWRDGTLTQVSTDHTFVQRLVDSGRITAEEARAHPRRSVLMRVLGDVDSSPEIDTWSLDTRPGDRWLICSDGLSGVVSHDDLSRALRRGRSARETADEMLRRALDGGAPDNVTIVLLDIGEDDGEDGDGEPVTVGSAATPLAFAPQTARSRALHLPSLRLHPIKPASGPTHFEPQAEDYLDELIEEDRRRVRRRRLTWLVSIVLLIAAIVVGCVLGYQWTQTRYYVGASPAGNVSIYKGVQQGLGPISLSHLYRETDTRVSRLPSYDREQVSDTINAGSLTEAEHIVREVIRDARG